MSYRRRSTTITAEESMCNMESNQYINVLAQGSEDIDSKFIAQDKEDKNKIFLAQDAFGKDLKNTRIKSSIIVSSVWIKVKVSQRGVMTSIVPPRCYKEIENLKARGCKIISSKTKVNVLYVFESQVSRSLCAKYVSLIEFPKKSSNRLSSFESQGLFDGVARYVRALRSVPPVMEKLERTVDMAHEVIQPVHKVVKPVFSASNAISDFVNKVLDFCKLFFSNVKLGFKEYTAKFMQFLWELLPSLKTTIADLEGHDGQEMGTWVWSNSAKRYYFVPGTRFESQSLDTVIIASLFGGIIGSRLTHILKSMSLFTRFKILDDLTFVQDFIAYVLEVPFLLSAWFRSKVDADSKTAEACLFFCNSYSKYLLEVIPFTRVNRFVKSFESLFQTYERDNSVLSRTDFKEGWSSFYEDYNSWKFVYLSTSKVLPLKIINIDKKVTDFNIRYLTYVNSTRFEPVCFLFYGPPGCGKSTMLSRLVKEIGLYRSVYTHASYQDRDFYDHYNNEDVFVMDDIGQKGVYQWADIINMVSTIRYPLNCAEASKKGTKHFSSSFLLFTSNVDPARLTLTADCGITDKEALCRRIKLIDFTQVRFNDGNWSGRWSCKTRDTETRQWIAAQEGDIINNEVFLDNIMCMFNYYSQKQNRTNSYEPTGNVGRLYIPFKENPAHVVDEQGFVHWEGNMMESADFDSDTEFDDDGIKINLKPVVGHINENSWSWKNPRLYHLGNESEMSDDEDTNDITQEDVLRIIANERPMSEVSYVSRAREEFVRLLCNTAEFLYKVFTLKFDSFSEFFSLIKDLVCRPLVAFGISVWMLFCSFIFVLYFYFKGKFYGKPRWETTRDVFYVNKRPGKLTRNVWLPDGFVTVEEVVRNKTANLEQVGCIKGVHFFDLNGVNRESLLTESLTGIAFCSGKMAIVPHHYVQEFDLSRKLFITIRSGDNAVLVDNAKVSQAFVDHSNDVCILNIEVSYQFPKIRFGDLNETINLDSVILATPYGAVNTGGSYADLGYKSEYYVHKTAYPLYSEDVVTNMSAKGLCGAIYGYNRGSCIVPLGMHVAGSTDGKMGICKKFSKSLIKFLSERPNNATAIIGGVPGMSKACTDVREFQAVPDKSTITPSSVAGVYPHERKPANLKVPVKDISKKSLTPTKNIDIDALDFAEVFIREVVPDFTKVSETVVVKGIKKDGVTVANPINKDSSCGFGYSLSKEDYLDYEKGEYRPFLREKISNLRSQLAEASVKVSDALHAEILKDELRNVEKVDKPRSFKMAPLHVTCLQREYLLDLLVKIHANRRVNGIRVCINPFSDEWLDLMNVHRKFGYSFDGDWGKWDGGMLPQFQSVLRGVLLDAFQGEKMDKVILDNLLLLIQNCPTITLDEVYYTTHSLPSGIALTAEYNSLINKMLTAYIFYVLYKEQFGCAPTLQTFMTTIRDDVYGDDKLVSTNADTARWFNGKSFERIANVLGLDFTPASKGEWTYTTQSIEKCTFLKRGFKYNDFLKAIVAPLEMKTITSTLNYVKDAARRDELTTIKLLNFQRELFLHGSEVYYRHMAHLQSFLDEIDFPIQFLKVKTLAELYSKGGLFDPLVMV